MKFAAVALGVIAIIAMAASAEEHEIEKELNLRSLVQTRGLHHYCQVCQGCPGCPNCQTCPGCTGCPGASSNNEIQNEVDMWQNLAGGGRGQGNAGGNAGGFFG